MWFSMSFCLPWRWGEYRQLKLVNDESELFLIFFIRNWSYLQSFRFVRTSVRPKCKVTFMSCLACIAGEFFGEQMLGVLVRWWIRHFGLVRSRRARNKETLTSTSLPSPPLPLVPDLTRSYQSSRNLNLKSKLLQASRQERELFSQWIWGVCRERGIRQNVWHKLMFIELSMGRHIGSVVVEFTINILL